MTLPVINGRRYGYRKSPLDVRDLGISSFGPARMLLSLPPAVDLEASCGPVRDQGAEGSCTAHAGVGMREFLARRYQGAAPILSPAFLYYQERVLDGDAWEDAGSDGRSMCKVMRDQGVCEESAEPYVAGDYAIPPTAAQVLAAIKWKGGAYHQIGGNVVDLKSCIASGYPFALGFTVYESFEQTGGDGLVPPINGDVLGGHETLVIGYDDGPQLFKVRNSWGTGWGKGGNFYVPYVMMTDPDFFLDAWIEHLGGPWGAAR